MLFTEATVPFRQSTGDTRCHTRTLPVHSRLLKVLTAPYHYQADRRTHARKKLVGSISRTSHLQVFRHRGRPTLPGECGMPGSQYIASALSPPGLARDHRLVKYYTLASCFRYNVRCLYHSLPPTTGITRNYSITIQ